MRNIKLTTTNTDAHQYTPENEYTNDGHSRRIGGDGLSERGEDDQDELETVHLLAAHHVGEPPKTKLSNNGATRRRNLDRSIRGLRDAAALFGRVPVDRAEHVRHHTDGEDVIRVGEEANAGDENGANVVPAKGSLINLGERETATLVGVGDVCIVVVEVVEGSVASRSSGGHDLRCSTVLLERSTVRDKGVVPSKRSDLVGGRARVKARVRFYQARSPRLAKASEHGACHPTVWRGHSRSRYSFSNPSRRHTSQPRSQGASAARVNLFLICSSGRSTPASDTAAF